MMNPRQSWRDAFDAQIAQVEWTRSDEGQRWLYIKFREESKEYEDPRTRAIQEMLYRTETSRIQGAVPIFVSADMCRLVEAAAETFMPEPIYPTDLLDVQGFMWYERPFVIPDRYTRPITIAAVSWSPALTDEDIKPDRLFTREDELHEWLEERHRQGKTDGLGITLYTKIPLAERESLDGMVLPPVAPIHLTPWWWGQEFKGNEVTPEGRPTGSVHWWKLLQVSFRLMQQTITVRHHERPHRAQRREAKRFHIVDRDVVVVRLRREKTQTNGEPMSEMHYTHRFIVHHHWRNQWYPSVGKHRQIFIADYEKGPEGAELVIRPRAYNWSR